MEKLLLACSQSPVDLNQVSRLISEGGYSPRALAQAMLRNIEAFCDEEREDGGPLIALLRLFLKHGLDPNFVIEGTCLLSAAAYIPVPYVGAEAVRLLLENGGDPNRMVDDESAFEEIDFDVIFGAVEQEDRRVYDAWVHAWLVMLGFGGRPQSGAAPIQMAQGVTAEVFRRHERFDFTVEKTKADPDGWQMHIFDRETGVEAAVL